MAVAFTAGLGLAAAGCGSGGGIDTSSSEYKAGYYDAGHWSFVMEDPATALNDCEAGVAHDSVLSQLRVEAAGWNDGQLVAWSQGCVAALRDRGMNIPIQSWEQ
ncbi:hypothetical protein ACPCC3_12520 [Streptomyces cellulosae]|uniref:hypothetical protein n=1 Tax=Streptomyces sp. UNC401CLCol TaxID=1449077 RepID=UPI00131A23CF